MIIVSVVRDFEIYDRLVRKNPFNEGAAFFAWDNRVENQGIPERYNAFLDRYDYTRKAWFVFCHEDWEIQEPWIDKIRGLDPAHLYGPIGVHLVEKSRKIHRYVLGQIQHSQRSGAQCTQCGYYVEKALPVETFDCQCLIVHSDLIQKTGLRFDTQLHFDLYVEDFCMCAVTQHRIQPRVIQLRCQHYSYGTLSDRFSKGIRYLQQKYQACDCFFSTTVSSDIIPLPCTKPIIDRRYTSMKTSVVAFLYQNNVTRSGRHLIKIFKIPVWWKKHALQ